MSAVFHGLHLDTPRHRSHPPLPPPPAKPRATSSSAAMVAPTAAPKQQRTMAGGSNAWKRSHQTAINGPWFFVWKTIGTESFSVCIMLNIIGFRWLQVHVAQKKKKKKLGDQRPTLSLLKRTVKLIQLCSRSRCSSEGHVLHRIVGRRARDAHVGIRVNLATLQDAEKSKDEFEFECQSI